MRNESKNKTIFIRIQQISLRVYEPDITIRTKLMEVFYGPTA